MDPIKQEIFVQLCTDTNKQDRILLKFTSDSCCSVRSVRVLAITRHYLESTLLVLFLCRIEWFTLLTPVLIGIFV